MATQRNLLGILGGMGPLASAELVSTIYRESRFDREQEAPACVLYSDPSIPDRTTALLAGDVEPVAARLTKGIEALLGMGAHRVVIACVTAHGFLPHVPEEVRRDVISIIDLAIDEIEASPGRFLLLATRGTRAARIFQDHPRWPAVESRVVLPGDEDQQQMHDWLYRIKQNEPLEPCIEWLHDLARSEKVDGLIFGCTELHLLHRAWKPAADGPELRIVDPLLTVAQDLPRLMS
jgi:aspartate racemase